MATLETATSATRPGAPSTGDMIYETDTQKVSLYDGSSWVSYTPDDAPYPFDTSGDTLVSKMPEFHFDASMINGHSATNNPDNADGFDSDVTNGSGGIWTSRTNGVKTKVQGTGSKVPTYYTSGTNSKPYMLSATDELDIDTDTLKFSPQKGGGPFTMFAVMEKTGSSSTLAPGGSYFNRASNTAGITGPASVWLHYSDADDYLGYNTGSDNDDAPTIGGGVASYEYTRMFLVVRDSSNNVRMYVDGNNTNTSLVGTTSMGMVWWDNIFKSWTFTTSGDLYELAYWPSDLSVADRNKLITYVNSKYGAGKNYDGSGTTARATFS